VVSMAKLERVYNIPLRKEWLKAPRHKRSKKAMKAVREFLMKHMKSEDVKLGRHLNEKVWEHGIKRPPHHVKVTAIKFEDGIVRAELVGYAVTEPKKEEETKKSTIEGLKEKITGSKSAPKAKKKGKAEKKAVKKIEKEKKIEKIKEVVVKQTETPKEAAAPKKEKVKKAEKSPVKEDNGFQQHK
jgi:large subunit ribosomal protein L31e